MTTTPITSITDELLAEIERECRAGADDYAGMGNEEESALFDRIGDTVSACAAELRRLRAENEALRGDAGRYRWLKENVKTEFYGDQLVDMFTCSSSKIDRLVDTAMQSNTEGN